jgi:hypothetical protein
MKDAELVGHGVHLLREREMSPTGLINRIG